MVLVCMSDDHPDQILVRLLDEAEIWHDEIDARQVLVGEADAEVDHEPLACARRPISVKSAIHPDFAQAAKRDEHELVVVRHLGAPFRRVGGAQNHLRRNAAARQEPDVGRLDGV